MKARKPCQASQAGKLFCSVWCS